VLGTPAVSSLDTACLMATPSALKELSTYRRSEHTMKTDENERVGHSKIQRKDKIAVNSGVLVEEPCDDCSLREYCVRVR
jgi:hypothetical protein